MQASVHAVAVGLNTAVNMYFELLIHRHGKTMFDICMVLNVMVDRGGFLFIYLGFYVAFNTVQIISPQIVLRPEGTSTYN